MTLTWNVFLALAIYFKDITRSKGISKHMRFLAL